MAQCAILVTGVWLDRLASDCGTTAEQGQSTGGLAFQKLQQTSIGNRVCNTVLAKAGPACCVLVIPSTPLHLPIHLGWCATRCTTAAVVWPGPFKVYETTYLLAFIADS